MESVDEALAELFDLLVFFLISFSFNLLFSDVFDIPFELLLLLTPLDFTFFSISLSLELSGLKILRAWNEIQNFILF